VEKAELALFLLARSSDQTSEPIGYFVPRPAPPLTLPPPTRPPARPVPIDHSTSSLRPDKKNFSFFFNKMFASATIFHL